jgi:DNA-binding transcriptional ArsR family regulator
MFWEAGIQANLNFSAKEHTSDVMFRHTAAPQTKARLFLSLQTTFGAIELVRVAGHLKERMIASLADPESRKIITAVIKKPKTAVDIEKETDLPQSTVYRKISELRECGLLMVERFIVRLDGRREALYSCPFTEVRFMATQGGIELELVQTEESLEKRWFELFFSRRGLS